MSEPGREGTPLVLALAHEVGNMLAAVRLEAGLLDADQPPRELARASLAIDGSCARAGTLLGLLRPLLAAAVEPSHRPASEIVRDAGAMLREEGVGGVSLRVDPGDDPAAPACDAEMLYTLLLVLGMDAIEAARPSGSVWISGSRLADQVALIVEDDGSEDTELADWRTEALRGRVLTCALAQALIEPAGGRVDAGRTRERTRIRLSLPVRAT